MQSEIVMRMRALRASAGYFVACGRATALSLAFWLAMLSPMVAGAQIRLTVDDVSIVEGDSGTRVAILVVRSSEPAPPGGISFDAVILDGTADSADYDRPPGFRGEISAGFSEAEIGFAVYGDRVVEPDETFFMDLSNPAGADIQDARGVVTILTDDRLPRLTVDDAVAVEGGSLQFVARLDIPAGPGGVSFDVATVDGTALADVDYARLSGSRIEIPDGERLAIVAVDTLPDALVEGEEFLRLDVANVAGVEPDALDARGTISDEAASRPVIEIADTSVIEGNSGIVQLIFQVTLSEAAAQTVSVDYRSDQHEDDIASTDGRLIFLPGETLKTLAVPVRGDTRVEPDIRISVELFDAVNADIGDGDADGTVYNDDTDLAILTTSFPDGQIALRYDRGVQVSGGLPPAVLAVTAGALPPGMVLLRSPYNGLYYIVETPTAAGTFHFTLTLTDNSPGPAGPFSVSRDYTIVIAAPVLALPPTTLPSATFDSGYYTVQLNPATGGTAPYRYAVTAGALPPGLSLGESGIINGTSAGSGTFEFTVTATDSSGGGGGPYSVSRAYTLVAEPPELEISTLFGLEGTAGSEFDDPISVYGGTEPYSVALSAGRLPTGLSLTGDYRIAGTPTEAGSFPITLTATDSTQIVPATVSADFVVTIAPPELRVSTYGLDGVLNMPFSDRIVAEGGIAPYRFTLSGALARGLRLDPDTGVIDGTPTEVGEFNVSITVVDSTTGIPGTLTISYGLTINGPTLNLTPAAGGLPPATAGVGYRLAFVASGGIGPYRYSIQQGSGLPPELGFDAFGQLSGTPIAAGTYTFSVTAVDETDSGLGPVTHAYILTIRAPEIRVAPPGLPSATRETAYSQTLIASGGTAPYGFSVTDGVLPPGLVLARDGVLAGTPTTVGTSLFVVTATDALGFTGRTTYQVSVFEAPPQAIDDTATAIAGTPVNIAVTANDAGPFASIAIATAPASGTAVVSGFHVVYTANPDFVGTDTFTYTLTGTGGNAQAMVTVSVGATPVARSRSLHAVAGVPMDIDVTEGATGGPFTAATLATIVPANSGTADIAQVGSGANARYVMTYFPLPEYAGSAAVTFTVDNGFATSAVATITFDIAPRVDPPITPPEAAAALGVQAEAEQGANPTPLARSRSVDAFAGVPIEVELTEGATGGPFTAATLVALTPATSGTAGIVRVGSDASARYMLKYTPATGYAGAATVTFTLGNGFSTSAVATIAIKVAPRPDPSRDAESRGLLNAQVESAQRFANTQTSNFQQRMERMHGAGEGKGFSNGLSAATQTYCPQEVGAMLGRRCARRGDDTGAAAMPQARDGNDSNAAFGVWASGTIRSGNQDGRNGDANVDFETDGVSVGVDYRLNDAFAFGGGVGYGRDESDIGDNGSRGEADAFTLALYASYSPGDRWFVDMLLGYQSLGYDLRRHVVANDSLVNGSRDGAQWFGSVSTGADIQRGHWQITPYARMDVVQATLDGYAETGDPLYALAYGELDVETTTGNAGVRIDYRREMDWGAFSPQLRLEYQRDFKGNGAQTMRYADAPSGPFYRTRLSDFDRSRLVLGAGLLFSADNDWSFKLDYRGLIGSGGDRDHGLQFEVGKRY